MTKMEKNQLYDDICDIITEYESEGESSIPNYVIEDMYYILVNVANRWEEINGEQDE